MRVVDEKNVSETTTSIEGNEIRVTKYIDSSDSTISTDNIDDYALKDPLESFEFYDPSIIKVRIYSVKK